MQISSTGMVPLGYGKFARADQIIALVPVEEGDRRGGRRTYVHLETVVDPIVASRSERAILADMETALTAPDAPHRRRRFTRRLPQDRRRAEAG